MEPIEYTLDPDEPEAGVDHEWRPTHRIEYTPRDQKAEVEHVMVESNDSSPPRSAWPAWTAEEWAAGREDTDPIWKVKRNESGDETWFRTDTCDLLLSGDLHVERLDEIEARLVLAGQEIQDSRTGRDR